MRFTPLQRKADIRGGIRDFSLCVKPSRATFCSLPLVFLVKRPGVRLSLCASHVSRLSVELFACGRAATEGGACVLQTRAELWQPPRSEPRTRFRFRDGAHESSFVAGSRSTRTTGGTPLTRSRRGSKRVERRRNRDSRLLPPRDHPRSPGFPLSSVTPCAGPQLTAVRFHGPAAIVTAAAPSP